MKRARISWTLEFMEQALGLPEDIVIQSAYYDHARRALAIYVVGNGLPEEYAICEGMEARDLDINVTAGVLYHPEQEKFDTKELDDGR